MSHYTCEHCGGRFRDEHTCDQDPESMAEEIASLRERIETIESKLAQLARLVTGDRSATG